MPARRYSSLEVVLEPQNFTLRVRGELVKVEPKVFELLSYLMRHHGRVVSKEELLDALWRSEVVGESVLTRCMSCARKLIGDDRRSPRFVRTVHGRGYEFVAPVTVESIDAASARLPVSVVPPRSASVPLPRSQRPFVGRDAELDSLLGALENLDSERRKVILISGETGIGKTRLLEEVAQRTLLAEVHWSRASDTEGAPPFFLWQQCFRSIARSRSMKVAQRALGDTTTQKLLLDTGRFAPGDVAGWDSAGSRFRLFDAVVRGLTELAAQRELVLLFDDLHAADLASLLMLAFFAEQARGPVLVLGTVREGAPIVDPAKRAVLARLRSTLSSEMLLGGLRPREISLLLGDVAEQPRETVAEQLFSRTGGNPLFLSLLVSQHGTVESAQALPSALRLAVSARLEALGHHARELLKVAAAFGSDFDAGLLAKAARHSEAECSEELREAANAGIVVRSATNRWAFVHDLLREVLYSELRSDELPRIHFQIASTLEELPEYQEARHAAMLARHLLLAANQAGSTRALDLTLRAGAHALRNFAYEEAVEHFFRARELVPACPDMDLAIECAILLDLGLAQVSAGDREAGRSTLQLAAEKARVLGAADQLAQVALSLAPGLFAIETGVYDPALVELLRDALAQVGTRNDGLRALLLARLALALYWSDTFEERRALCDEARKLADSLGARDVLAAVTTARAFALLRPNNLAERRELAERGLELSRGMGDRQLLMLNHLLLGAAELELGDVAAFVFQTELFRELAEETRQPQSLWIVQAHRACRLLMDGRLDEVEALSGECLAVGQRIRDHNALLTFGVHLTLVRIEQGRANEVLPAIRDYAARYPLIVGWRVLHAYALSRAGDERAAEAEYRSLQAREFQLPDDLNWMVSMAWLAELSHAFRDRGAAALLYERLVPFADRLVVVGYAIACLGSVQHYLALLASTLGRERDARRHFDETVEKNRRASATLPLLHSISAYAGFLAEYESSHAARALLAKAEELVEKESLKTVLQSRHRSLARTPRST